MTYPLDRPIDLINAWYIAEWVYNYGCFINREDGFVLSKAPNFVFRYDDSYLRMDGKIIDFLEFKPKVEKFGPFFEKSTCSRGDCYILRCGMKTESCGIQQNVFITDTIYEIKYDKPLLRYLTGLEFTDYGYDNDEIVCLTYKMISSLQPKVEIDGKGYSIDEIIDMGEDPTRTNRSLPFHIWNVRINLEGDVSDEDRDGVLRLLDNDGNVVQTINL